MDAGIFVPLIVFSAITIISVSAFYFGFRRRQTAYDTVKTAIEKTGQVDDRMLEALTRSEVGPYGDLRRGVLLIAAALAFVILGFLVPDDEALRPMIGVASFPGLIGLAYVAFHFFAPRNTPA